MGSILSTPTVRYSLDHNGIEVTFPDRPDQHTLNILKGLGFHWSARAKLWYRRFNPYSWDNAHRALNLPTPPIPAAALRAQARDYHTAARQTWPADPVEIARELA